MIINKKDVEASWDKKRPKFSVEIYIKETIYWSIRATEVVGYEKKIDRYTMFYNRKKSAKVRY